jgi:hypothetical protein
MSTVKTFQDFISGGDTIETPNIKTNLEMPQPEPGIDRESQPETENYMFFSNLETIQRLIKIMMEMDPMKVDQLLKNGHNWAEDHVTSSKDDLEEVADFLMGEMTKPETEVEEGSHNYSCNECGLAYETHEVTEDRTCSCGSKLEENWG